MEFIQKNMFAIIEIYLRLVLFHQFSQLGGHKIFLKLIFKKAPILFLAFKCNHTWLEQSMDNCESTKNKNKNIVLYTRIISFILDAMICWISIFILKSQFFEN